MHHNPPGVAQIPTPLHQRVDHGNDDQKTGGYLIQASEEQDCC
jgi:hypothetical protein